MFGLAFTITVSGVLILLDLFLFRLLLCSKKFSRLQSSRLQRWVQDGVFQMQRRAYEAHGLGNWEHLSTDIPVTTESIDLPDLPVSSDAAMYLSEPRRKEKESLPVLSDVSDVNSHETHGDEASIPIQRGVQPAATLPLETAAHTQKIVHRREPRVDENPHGRDDETEDPKPNVDSTASGSHAG